MEKIFISSERLEEFNEIFEKGVSICYFNHSLSLLKCLVVLLMKFLDGHLKTLSQGRITESNPYYINNFDTKVTIIHISKLAEKFKGSCLKQDCILKNCLFWAD